MRLTKTSDSFGGMVWFRSQDRNDLWLEPYHRSRGGRVVDIQKLYGQAIVRNIMPVTNAERIRAMSDEELADFIGGIFTLERDLWGDYDPRTVVTQEPRVELRSREDALDWLKQEAAE